MDSHSTWIFVCFFLPFLSVFASIPVDKGEYSISVFHDFSNLIAFTYVSGAPQENTVVISKQVLI